MAFQQSGARQIDEQWKEITNKVIDCVLDNSPNDKTLAYYGLPLPFLQSCSFSTFRCPKSSTIQLA